MEYNAPSLSMHVNRHLDCFYTLTTVKSAEHWSAPYLFELVFSSFTDTC